MITVEAVGERHYKNVRYKLSADSAAILKFLYNNKNIRFTGFEVANALSMPSDIAINSLGILFTAKLITREGTQFDAGKFIYKYSYELDEVVNFE